MLGPVQWTREGMVPALTSGTGASTLARAAARSDEGRDDDLDEDDDLEALTPARQAPDAARPKHKPAPQKLPPPPNVLKLARARLRAVERELKRLRRLEQEHDELRRIIDAATNKPRAVVRQIPGRDAVACVRPDRKTSAG